MEFKDVISSELICNFAAQNSSSDDSLVGKMLLEHNFMSFPA